jgi:hypothetical protein
MTPAGNGACNTRQEDASSHGARRCDTDDKDGARDDAVVRSENCGAEPANSTRSMPFTMSQHRPHGRFLREAAADFGRGRLTPAA